MLGAGCWVQQINNESTPDLLSNCDVKVEYYDKRQKSQRSAVENYGRCTDLRHHSENKSFGILNRLFNSHNGCFIFYFTKQKISLFGDVLEQSIRVDL
jgi:hypothetical protein